MSRFVGLVLKYLTFFAIFNLNVIDKTKGHSLDEQLREERGVPNYIPEYRPARQYEDDSGLTRKLRDVLTDESNVDVEGSKSYNNKHDQDKRSDKLKEPEYGCNQNTCPRNRGRCTSEGTCRCFPRYEGEHCQNKVNPCSNAPCQNGGNCHRSGISRGYYCSCASGFYGSSCQHQKKNVADAHTKDDTRAARQTANTPPDSDIARLLQAYSPRDRAESSPQRPNYPPASSSWGNQSPSYSSQQSHGPCSYNPCKNGGACTERWNDFECRCPFGLSGKTCDQMSSQSSQFNRPHQMDTICSPAKCSFNGNCMMTPQGPICQCNTGFVGERCNIASTNLQSSKQHDDQPVTITRGMFDTVEQVMIGLICFILVTSLVLIIHCTRVRHRRKALKTVYSETVKSGSVPMITPPDIIETSNMLCIETLCCRRDDKKPNTTYRQSLFRAPSNVSHLSEMPAPAIKYSQPRTMVTTEADVSVSDGDVMEMATANVAFAENRPLKKSAKNLSPKMKHLVTMWENNDKQLYKPKKKKPKQKAPPPPPPPPPPQEEDEDDEEDDDEEDESQNAFNPTVYQERQRLYMPVQMTPDRRNSYGYFQYEDEGPYYYYQPGSAYGHQPQDGPLDRTNNCVERSDSPCYYHQVPNERFAQDVIDFIGPEEFYEIENHRRCKEEEDARERTYREFYDAKYGLPIRYCRVETGEEDKELYREFDYLAQARAAEEFPLEMQYRVERMPCYENGYRPGDDLCDERIFSNCNGDLIELASVESKTGMFSDEVESGSDEELEKESASGTADSDSDSASDKDSILSLASDSIADQDNREVTPSEKGVAFLDANGERYHNAAVGVCGSDEEDKVFDVRDYQRQMSSEWPEPCESPPSDNDIGNEYASIKVRNNNQACVVDCNDGIGPNYRRNPFNRNANALNIQQQTQQDQATALTEPDEVTYVLDCLECEVRTEPPRLQDIIQVSVGTETRESMDCADKASSTSGLEEFCNEQENECSQEVCAGSMIPKVMAKFDDKYSGVLESSTPKMSSKSTQSWEEHPRTEEGFEVLYQDTLDHLKGLIERIDTGIEHTESNITPSHKYCQEGSDINRHESESATEFLMEVVNEVSLKIEAESQASKDTGVEHSSNFDDASIEAHSGNKELNESITSIPDQTQEVANENERKSIKEDENNDDDDDEITLNFRDSCSDTCPDVSNDMDTSRSFVFADEGQRTMTEDISDRED